MEKYRRGKGGGEEESGKRGEEIGSENRCNYISEAQGKHGVGREEK